jgi:hypothetical protein
LQLRLVELGLLIQNRINALLKLFDAGDSHSVLPKGAEQGVEHFVRSGHHLGGGLIRLLKLEQVGGFFI